MKYFVSAFLPFMGFFYIKKPVYGYLCLLLFLISILSLAVYPSALLFSILYVVMILWSFFEINDYHSKQVAKRMVNYIEKKSLGSPINYGNDDIKVKKISKKKSILDDDDYKSKYFEDIDIDYKPTASSYKNYYSSNASQSGYYNPSTPTKYNPSTPYTANNINLKSPAINTTFKSSNMLGNASANMQSKQLSMGSMFKPQGLSTNRSNANNSPARKSSSIRSMFKPQGLSTNRSNANNSPARKPSSIGSMFKPQGLSTNRSNQNSRPSTRPSLGSIFKSNNPMSNKSSSRDVSSKSRPLSSATRQAPKRSPLSQSSRISSSTNNRDNRDNRDDYRNKSNIISSMMGKKNITFNNSRQKPQTRDTDSSRRSNLSSSRRAR